MPITLTLPSTYVLSSVLDGDFGLLQDLLRSGLQQVDTTSGLFHRWKLVNRAAGKVASVSVLNAPRMEQGGYTPLIKGKFDVSFRHGLENAASVGAADWEAVVDAGPWSNFAMELLGRPGPSFVGEWQELSLPEPTGAVGWPPSWWPSSRYPKDLCYSRWLTVPGAGVRVYVPERAVARIKGSAAGALNFFRTCITQTCANIGGSGAFANDRACNLGRFAIIVDTNPILYTDEWPNTNVNILNPVSGAMATHTSWKVLRDRTFHLPQRGIYKLDAEVALYGGRYYSFRLAYRDAATHGWVDMTGGAPGTYRDTLWELSNPAYMASPNKMDYQATWLAERTAKLGAYNHAYPFYPSWINLWDASHMSVELDYGRATAYIEDSSFSEFTTKAT